MRPVKLGIIGCGIAARDLHWPALRQLKDKFEITVVCNHTEAKAQTFAELVGGVPYVLDYHELLQRQDVEAVDLALPIHLNYAVTKEVLLAGKHVMVEKPLAANLPDARKLVTFAKRLPLVMMVAENFRYRKTFHQVKSYLEQGRIGAICVVFWNVFYHIDQNNKYAKIQWRVQHQYPGGFITDGGIHNIAAIRYLFGDITTGTAFTRCINPGLGELDTMSFQFTTTQKIHGTFNVSCSSAGYSENRIIILGTRGSMVIENNRITLTAKGQAVQQETVLDDGGYIGEFEDFYAAIRQNQQVKSTFWEAYQDLRVMLKALDTAKKGHRFTIKFQEKKHYVSH